MFLLFFSFLTYIYFLFFENVNKMLIIYEYFIFFIVYIIINNLKRNIIKFYECITENEKIYIITELMNGGSLTR